MRFLRNVRRAWKYNKSKHVPPEEFVGGLEDIWRRSLDKNSRSWLLSNGLAVDLLHQMLTGQLTAGDENIDYDVFVVLLDRMILSPTSTVDPKA